MQTGSTNAYFNHRGHCPQQGQAMVEFAIILILLVILVVGGAELAITAYGSSKVSEAAKAGAAEWAQFFGHAKAPSPPAIPQPDVGLGDHDPATNAGIISPSCGEGSPYTYDDGLPDDRYLVDKKNQDNHDPPFGNGRRIYLFNPLPIDISGCDGKDPDRGNQSRLSILVNGYGNDLSDPLYVPGLPKTNRAMYSMYQKVCLSGEDYVKCDGITPLFLKPPGKLCLSNDANKEGCPGELNNDQSGYYFFGHVNDAAEDSFEYTQDEVPEFRPVFQLECGGAGHTSSGIMSGCDPATHTVALCANPQDCDVTVHARYRSVFESFMTFGLQKLSDSTLLPYFFNPARVCKPVSNEFDYLASMPGAEIGPIAPAPGGVPGYCGDGGDVPTVKQFKDFRGCFLATDLGTVTTPNYQIISCN